MKKPNKVISIVLAIVMMLSVVAPAYAGTLKIDKYPTVEKLIQNDSLAELVDSLISDLNGAKQNITGTVLRFCFLFIDDDSLQAAIGDTDVVNAEDGALAKILLDWLNANLPEWTEDITSQSWYSTVQTIVKLLSIDLDLSSVNGVVGTLYDLCNALNGKSMFGDLKNINGSALKGVSYNGKGDSALNVIYQLFQWLDDNSGLITSVVKGGIGSKGLSLGNTINNLLGDSLDDFNTTISNLPLVAKSYIYLLIDGYAEAGKLDGTTAEAKGGWGTSAYKDFSADELLAAALIKLVRNNDEVVSQKDAKAALNLSFYELLSNNIGELFESYDVAGWFTESLTSAVKSITGAGIKNIFKTGFTFTNDTFAAIFENSKTTGILGQVNNILVTVCKVILTDDNFKALELVEGDNTNLNANFAKICRYILPLMANETVKKELGYDFTAFTAEAVKDMSLSDMAAAILKLFYEDWFGSNAKFNKTVVAKADSLEDLAALAVYYTASNTEWLNLKGVTITAPTADDDATTYILNTAALIGLGSLNYNADDLYFKTELNGTEDYNTVINEASNWAINFIDGIPAVTKTAKLSTKEVMYGDAFYKLNVIINELVDFAFYTNESENTTFDFDLGLFIKDTLLDNLYDFDLEGILNCVKKNDRADNSLNKSNVVTAVLEIVDRIVTSLFKTTCTKATKTAETEPVAVGTEATCATAEKVTYTYCAENGYYLAEPTKEAITIEHDFVKNEEKSVAVGATCKESGYDYYECSVCGYSYTEENAEYADHDFVDTTFEATCKDRGYVLSKCSVCGEETKAYTTEAPVDHSYVDGKCQWCGAAEPSSRKLGDVDGDDNISAADARLALRASVNLESFAEGSDEFKAADADKDGKISAADARLILRASVNLETLG